ncbi:hypothetical protein GCM10023196_097230 [Actinoallomurus vinaceus]|uniref:Uncharacterized protein n=1 Tax=Actinoallomurus vinaceus TaxID=1080074 RepID=A0ABP8UUW0_9ACTN
MAGLDPFVEHVIARDDLIVHWSVQRELLGDTHATRVCAHRSQGRRPVFSRNVPQVVKRFVGLLLAEGAGEESPPYAGVKQDEGDREPFA